MTCYMRHLRGLFDALDLPYDAATRTRVDSAIRESFGFGIGVHCPEIWAAIKPLSPEELATRVRNSLGNQG